MTLLLSIDASSCSEAAVQVVADCFRPSDTTIRILHVIDWCYELSACATYSEGPSAGRDVILMEDALRRRRLDLLAHATRRLSDAGFVASSQMVEGEPGAEILAMAAHWPADVVVLGSHNRHGTDRILLGSISDRVCRHASCSVLIARPRTFPHDGEKFPLQTVDRFV